MTEAEMCRANGWKVGDTLELIHEFGSLRSVTNVLLTAIGQREVLGIQTYINRHTKSLSGEWFETENKRVDPFSYDAWEGVQWFASRGDVTARCLPRQS